MQADPLRHFTLLLKLVALSMEHFLMNMKAEMTKIKKYKLYSLLIGDNESNLSFVFYTSAFTIALASAVYIGKFVHEIVH
jgi:hypothetical protein